jgi:SAM-dependent methyltransferase
MPDSAPSAGFRPPLYKSRIAKLFEDGELDRHEAFLRAELAADLERKRAGKLDTDEARQLLSMPWWQRIADERLGITTLSDHDRLDDVAGPLHTLYGRLSEREAALMRPTAKWLYMEKHIPDLAGKSVLEIGSSCGFWSLKFAELGAARVTGVEAIAEHVESAREMARRKGLSHRVSFIAGDAFYDDLPVHDIVFYSEVLGHSLVPHHAFLRTLGLARELVIADEYFGWDDETNGQFFLSDDPDHALMWTGFVISENAALTLCHLAGVDLANVTRYRNQYNRSSTLMIIRMDGAAERRQARLRHVSQQMMVAHAMGLRPAPPHAGRAAAEQAPAQPG